MNILTGLTGLVIGAVAAWQVARGWAAAELSHLRAYLEEQIGYWQGEAERAKIHAAQLSEQTAAWVAGLPAGPGRCPVRGTCPRTASCWDQRPS